jgi:tRNA(adenine34) deaminase
VQRFIELTIRRGSSLASLERHDPQDLIVVLRGFASYLPNDMITAEVALKSAVEFLSHAGSWLNEKPTTLLLQTLKKGLIYEATVGYLKTNPDTYTREQLEAGVLAEEERRDNFRHNMRQVLQKQNRELNGRRRIQHANDTGFMREALEYAKEAAKLGEIPVGCVIVKDGEIIGVGHNMSIATNDPSAHAEVVAIRKAARALENYRLKGCTLYVTLEPCVMCAGLIAHARIDRVVYGAKDAKTGAYGSAIDLGIAAKLNHRPQVDSGLLADEASKLLTEFFEQKRHG